MTRLRHLLHSMIKVSAVIKAVVAGEARARNPTSFIPTETSFIYLIFIPVRADGCKDHPIGSYYMILFCITFLIGSHTSTPRSHIFAALACVFTRYKPSTMGWVSLGGVYCFCYYVLVVICDVYCYMGLLLGDPFTSR